MSEQSHVYEFILRPHTALSQNGFLCLMAFVMAISFGTGVYFTLLGAWPVLGFFGLEVGLLYAAFRWNYFVARRYEVVRLSQERVLVERVSPRGERQAWSYNPHWLRINLLAMVGDETDKDFGLPATNELVFSSHGQRLSIGRFLSPAERQELYGALSHALGCVRRA